MKTPNLAYRAALWKGKAMRQAYRALLPSIVRRKIEVPRDIAIQVFAYSNEQMLPEQVASIRSFLRWVGRPSAFTVVSDGSHSRRSHDLLRNIDQTVVLTVTRPLPSQLPEPFRDYLLNHPTGKQLALIMSLPEVEPALYLDADVLFFQGAGDLAAVVCGADAPAYYLPDCQFSGDTRLIADRSEEVEPVNTGVLLLFRKLDWSVAIERFLTLHGPPAFHTNQTLTHLVMHKNGARALDPVKYVLQLDDQTRLRDEYASNALVLRHYVNPVRHKFWTSLR